MELMQKEGMIGILGYASWAPQLAVLNHPVFIEGPFPRDPIDPSGHDRALTQALYVVTKHRRFLQDEIYHEVLESTCGSVMDGAMRSMMRAWFECRDFQILESGIDWFDATHKDSNGGFPTRNQLCLIPKLRSITIPAIPLPFSGVSTETWHQSLIASMIEDDYMFRGDWVGFNSQDTYNSLLRITITPWPPRDATDDDAPATFQVNESGNAKQDGEPINIRITFTETFRGSVEHLYGTVTTSTSNSGASIGRIVAKGPDLPLHHIPEQVGIDCVLTAMGIVGQIIFPAYPKDIGDDIWLWRENDETSM